jgi:hypothetical protein
MTERDWLTSKDGDAMLAVVADRLSERKWALLACGVARRVLDLLTDEPFRLAVDTTEKAAGEIVIDETVNLEGPAVTFAARERKRAELIKCDPDAEGEQFRESEGRRTNPAVPLFEAASRTAGEAVEYAGEAVEAAVHAVYLACITQGSAVLHQVRQYALVAHIQSARVGILSALALDLKARGDEMADRGQPKNAAVRLSEAHDTADRLEETAGHKVDRLNEQKTRSENAALAKLLREQIGNPFQPYRFEPQWRTETVLALAAAIDAERAFDRMPILADALLDADCDEELVLRHCRGTEPHARGCWVLDLILGREPDLFAAGPPKPAPPRRTIPLGPYTPPQEGMA